MVFFLEHLLFTSAPGGTTPYLIRDPIFFLEFNPGKNYDWQDALFLRQEKDETGPRKGEWKRAETH
jgi:hypothetical protein